VLALCACAAVAASTPASTSPPTPPAHTSRRPALVPLPATAPTKDAAPRKTAPKPVEATAKASAKNKPSPPQRSPEEWAQRPMSERRLRAWRRELGALTPKSLVASNAGHVFAQNMIYNHSVSVFDADGNRVTDISDRIPRDLLGLAEPPAKKPTFVRGAPVEAAVTGDGTRLFVSNYYILGKGFPGNVTDECELDQKVPSYVYEIDVPRMFVTRAIQVGSTPKFLALTPDERTLVVANWCDASVSVVDLTGASPTVRVPTGSFPRGIAIEPDGKTAYVAVMGRHAIAVVDLAAHAVVRVLKPGKGPRHLLMTKAGELLATLSHEASVVVLDKQTGEVMARAKTGRDPRSMALSTDETAVYVANYDDESLAVVALDTMTVVQRIATGPHPIGVAFEPTQERVWVSCYGGSVRVYDSKGASPHPSVRYIADEAKRFPP
jgi:YVTN family beta-propeller protein